VLPVIAILFQLTLSKIFFVESPVVNTLNFFLNCSNVEILQVCSFVIGTPKKLSFLSITLFDTSRDKYGFKFIFVWSTYFGSTLAVSISNINRSCTVVRVFFIISSTKNITHAYPNKYLKISSCPTNKGLIIISNSRLFNTKWQYFFDIIK